MAPKGVLGVKFGPVLALLGTLSLCSILGMATEIVDVRWEANYSKSLSTRASSFRTQPRF